MKKQRQERRRKFHESLVNILYAPPPSPPPPPPPPQKEIPEQLHETTLGDEHITDELEEEKSSLSASDDETEVDTAGKLTRAQRKRVRKKRLKEAALTRRKIIGPELPSSTNIGDDHSHPEGGDDVVNQQTQGVRRNAAEGMDSGSEQQLGDTSSCTSQNKRKQRRVSRKLAKERLKPLTMEDCDPPTCPDTNNEA